MPESNQASNVDVFAANTIYPDSKTIFSGSKTLQEVRDNCLITIDTNALLIPYLIGPNSFSQIQKTYKILADQKRIVIPGQVAREFAKNRANKITELYQQLNRRKLNLQKGKYPLLEEIPRYLESIGLEPQIGDLLAKYNNALDDVLQTIQSWEWNDPVSLAYQEIFGADSILDPAFDHEAVTNEFRLRYQQKIPPGYKDSGKEDEGIGDFLIWRTILEIGKAKERSVVLVSGEQKSDWRIKSEGKALYPRYELVDEFKRVSGGQSFHILQFSNFLTLYGATEATVQEVRQKELEISTPLPEIRIPNALAQILMVYSEVANNNTEYTDAIKKVADRLGISEKSVADKCTRKIGINTQTFRKLLQEPDALMAHLIDWFPEHEDMLYEEFDVS